MSGFERKMTSWILIAAVVAQSFVCEVDQKRRVSYTEIPGCENRILLIDPATSPSVPLFLPAEPTLSELEEERLELWRGDPHRRGVCVVRVNPAVFDADVVTVTIDGRELKFKIWSNSPGGDNAWDANRDAWSGQRYGSTFDRLYISRKPSTPESIYVSLEAADRRLEVVPLLVGGTHLALTDYRRTIGGVNGKMSSATYATDPARRARFDRWLLHKFPDEATYGDLRSSDALARELVARSPSHLDLANLFDHMYGPYLGRLKRMWAGAPAGFTEYVPGEVADTMPRVVLEHPCAW